MIILIFKFYSYQTQTIHASCNCKRSCEEQLVDLRKEAAEFFTKFDQEHDIAHQDLENIQMATSLFTLVLDSFVSANYGADIDQSTLSCILRRFLDVFNVKLDQTKQDVRHLQSECDTLVDIADDFRWEHNLVCKHGALRGCEADLNKLRCDLSAFFKVLNKSARKAKTDLQGIDRACNYLGNIATKFNSDYHPTCDVNGNSNQSNLKRNIKGIFSEVRKRTDAGVQNLDDLTSICDNLTIAIDSWNARLA